MICLAQIKNRGRLIVKQYKNQTKTKPPKFLVERSQTVYNIGMEKQHIPVLLSEVLASLAPKPEETYLDLTAGYGGHASKILDVTGQYKNSVLVDRDINAVKYLRAKFPPTITIKHTDFYNAVLQLLESGKTFDMILADFGVSSPQLDEAERGFSIKHDGHLDMRMDQAQHLTASDIVNKYSERDLAEIFVHYGEESKGRAKMLAREIVTHRPIITTGQLATIVAAKSTRHSRIHPATQVFQAIRIVVNGELDEIQDTLPILPKLLNKNGRLALITFHSLEDRLVKNYFNEATSHGEESELTVLTKKPIVAGPQELVINPRARSSKLRVAIRN